jgi:hypothetical protein
MVKSLKLVQKKLAPKYYGPYEVISKTPKGNYFLRDRTKKQLPKAIPRARLKVAPDFQNNGPYLQIDKILKDRINKGVKEYYVKWKGYPDSENSWEPEQNFSNIECLEDYNDLKSETVSVVHVNQIKIHKSGQNLNSFHVIFLFILICLCKLTNQMTIVDNFQYCALTSTSSRIRLENLCPISINTTQQTYNIFPAAIRIANLTILAKRQNKISGLGIQCVQETLAINATWRWYLAYDVSNIQSSSIHLTKEDCIKMQESKQCGQHKMQCINDECYFEQKPEPEWNWLRISTSHGIRCSLKPILILSNDLSTPLFVGNSPHVCLPIDTQCQLASGIIIWNLDIIHEFNYDFILSASFIVHSDDPVELNEGNLIYSELNQLLLNLQNVIWENEIKILSTSEGLYVIDTKLFNENKDRLNIKINKDNQNAIQQLTLSDIDYKTHLLLRFQLRFNRVQCHFFQSILQLYTQFQNQFFPIYSVEGTKLILYTMNQELFIPHCIQVNEIQTLHEDNCYEYVPIQFKYNEINKVAFLDSNRVICDNAISKPCQFNNQHIYLEDSKRLIAVIRNQVTLGVIPSNSFEVINHIYTDFSQLNYRHNQELLKGVDLTSFYLSLNTIPHNLGDTPVLYFPSTAAVLIETEKANIIAIFHAQIHRLYWYIIYIIIFIITCIFICLLIFCACKHYSFIKRKCYNFYKKHPLIFFCQKSTRNIHFNEEIEMSPLSNTPQFHLRQNLITNVEDKNTVEETETSPQIPSNNKIQPAYPNTILHFHPPHDGVRLRNSVTPI